ncbi:MAG: single-stranded DNA-binding protein [Brevinematia bacterium]
MARSFNKVIIVGNLVKDPEQETLTKTGKKVLRIRIAVNDSYKNSETTYFFDVVLWEGLVDIIKNYTRKGSKILVEGSLIQRSWTTKDEKGSEVKKTAVEIRAENILLLSPKGESAIKAEGVTNQLTENIKEIPKKEGKYESFINSTSYEEEGEGETFEDFDENILEDEEKFFEEIEEKEIDYNKIDREDNYIEDINTDDEFKV